jgi:hypothetical protein
MEHNYKNRISGYLEKHRSWGRSKKMSDRKIREYIINFDIKNSTDEDIRNFMAWLQVELRIR